MDFNFLYQRKQVELMRAEAAASVEARAAHQQLARLYGEEIDARRALSARAAND